MKRKKGGRGSVAERRGGWEAIGGAEGWRASPQRGACFLHADCGGHIDAPAQEETVMELKRSGSQPSQNGPPEHFTGAVRIAPLFASSPPARAAGAYVTFEP